RRGCTGGARLVEAERDPDLDRRAGDDGGRRRVALRPPAASGSAGAAEGTGRGSGAGGMMRLARSALCAAAMLLASQLQAVAVLPDEVLADPQLEQRARSLSAELRCMVCQNQSIDDSDAELARDLRILVRERL